MVVTVLLVAIVAAGVTITVRGILALRGRHRPRVSFLERQLIEVLSPKDEELPRVLGRLRIVYGLFLVVVGAWGLIV